jgi:hypothetical protein
MFFRVGQYSLYIRFNLACAESGLNFFVLRICRPFYL